jgi:hypothetical protein
MEVTMADPTPQEKEQKQNERIQRVPSLSDEQLEGVKAVCEKLALPKLSDGCSIGDSKDIEFCQATDVELQKRGKTGVKGAKDAKACGI